MIYIFFLVLIVLVIILFNKLKDYIDTKFIQQHNGILLDIKKQLDVQDEIIKQLFRELNISVIDTTPALPLNKKK